MHKIGAAVHYRLQGMTRRRAGARRRTPVFWLLTCERLRDASGPTRSACGHPLSRVAACASFRAEAMGWLAARLAHAAWPCAVLWARRASRIDRRHAPGMSLVEPGWVLTRRTPPKQRAHEGPFSWRRGWDSNPRYGKTVHRISNPAHSTTLPPLLSGATSRKPRIIAARRAQAGAMVLAPFI